MEDEFKKIFKLNSECLLKYIAYKYFQEGNYFIIQVIVKKIIILFIKLYIIINRYV
jgi:hypothetical protein